MKKAIVYGAGISGQGVAEVLEHQGWEVKIYTDDMGDFDPYEGDLCNELFVCCSIG